MGEARIYQTALSVASRTAGQARVGQAAIAISARTREVLSDTKAFQAALAVSVRPYAIEAVLERSPVIALPHICACHPVPLFKGW